MHKPLPAPGRAAPGSAVSPEPTATADVAEPEKAAPTRSRAPSVQFLDFRTTPEGREYTLRALGPSEPRLFVLIIPNEAFTSRAVRFQDGPDLCFRRLQRELSADPDLLPGGEMVLSAEEISVYRAGREQPVAERRRRHGA